ncbi:MAG TPA: hypothetical protein DEP05_01380 [Betaproteobacteria bacterium]|nr:hypothetical protein [Betaproteobacteria bacterium]
MSKLIGAAAIQLNCEPGRIDRNLAHAAALTEHAAAQGAKLVLLSELTPSGYMATEALWHSAGTIDGRSVTGCWTQRNALAFISGLAS